MTANFTKGEWVADIRVGIATVHVKTPNKFECLDGMRDQCMYWAEGKWDGKQWGVTAEQEANAHLIAAAPDMYDALKDLLDMLQYPDYNAGHRQHRIEEALSALAKAEGKVIGEE